MFQPIYKHSCGSMRVPLSKFESNIGPRGLRVMIGHPKKKHKDSQTKNDFID